MMQLNCNGYTYSIHRLENEIDRSYHLRAWYIVRQNPKNSEDFITALKKAKLYVNTQLLGCEYHPNVKKLFLKNLPSCF